LNSQSEPQEHFGYPLATKERLALNDDSGEAGMSGVNKNFEADETDVENGQALTLPCISPLHSIPGFDRLSRRKLYPKGSVLLVEGHAPRGVHVLCAGRAKLSITSAEGKTLIVRIARPGDLLGIHATLAAHPYEATAETLELCRVDFISRKDLLVLLERQKSSGIALAMAISKEFTEFVEHARILLLSVSAAQKLARLLLRLGDEFGERTATGIRLQTLLTHEQIAQMIGTSRETVTRLLGELRRKHILSLADNAIFVRNRKALESVARC
jgi:CRP/FNR family cyclic AMP-dependent transcriptional regulator